MIDFCLQISRIDFGNQFTGIYDLIVSDVNLEYVTRNFRADLNDVSVDECVVGRFVRTRIRPVTDTEDNGQQKNYRGGNQENRPPVKRSPANVFVLIHQRLAVFIDDRG